MIGWGLKTATRKGRKIGRKKIIKSNSKEDIQLSLEKKKSNYFCFGFNSTELVKCVEDTKTKMLWKSKYK